MKFQIGDKVLVRHSEEEGEVVDIINSKMVMVDVRGVKFPAYADQLDFPYFKQFTEKKLFPEKKQKKFIDQLPRDKKPDTTRKETGMWLTFLPVFDSDEFGDDVVESLKVHLVNGNSAGYRFNYKLQYLGKQGFELGNEVLGFQDFYLHDIPFENLNDSPVFEFDFIPLVADKKLADHFESSVKLKPKQVFTRIEDIKKKGEATFSYKLFDQFPVRAVEEKMEFAPLSAAGYKIYEASKARQHLEQARYEVDLHIEKLSENWKNMSNFEILTLQLATLEKYIDINMAHRLPSMIVIHGVGTGKLRDEIHEILRIKRGIKSFIHQYDPRYGYGATEIYFQY